MIGSEWHTGQSTADWWIQLVKTKTVYCIYGTAYRVNPIGKVTCSSTSKELHGLAKQIKIHKSCSQKSLIGKPIKYS